MYSLRHQVLMNSFGARNNENRAEWVEEVHYQLGVRALGRRVVMYGSWLAPVQKKRNPSEFGVR